MSTRLDCSTHKQTAALMTALRTAGWTITAIPYPGNVLWSHPRSGEELPTPDYMLGSPSWPFATYCKLRQLTFNHNGERIEAVWLRECAAPWVSESKRHSSFKKAIEYIQEDWTPR